MKNLITILSVFALFSIEARATDFNNTVDEIFSEINSNTSPGCSVGVIENGELIHKAGYGLANMELGIQLDGSHVHRVGSVSKQFTAMAVLLLAEEGKISLTEEIRTYLPELREYGSRVTVNAMLGHVAGMADYDYVTDGDNSVLSPGANIQSVAGGPFRLGNEDYLTIQEFYDVVKRVPLRYPSNQQYQYSNLAYFLLSMLVEEVSGQSLRDYSDENIFQPLGMSQSFFSDEPTEIVPNRASGYRPNEDGYITDMTNLFWVGDGGLHTNIEDMVKWDQNFYEPRVGQNPEELLQVFNTPNSDFDSGGGGRYANGQQIRKSNARLFFAHSGGWLGTTTFYARFPDDRFSVVVFCNDISLNPGQYVNNIVDAYFQD